MPLWIRVIVYVLGAWLIVCALAFLFQRRLLYFPDATSAAPARRGPGPGQSNRSRFSPRTGCASTPSGGRARTGGRQSSSSTATPGTAAIRVDGCTGSTNAAGRCCCSTTAATAAARDRPRRRGSRCDAEAAAAWLESRGYERHGLPRLLDRLRRRGRDSPARRPPVGLDPPVRCGRSRCRSRQRAYPFLPMRLLMRDRFDVRDGRRHRSRSPALSIHGDLDRIVPLSLGPGAPRGVRRARRAGGTSRAPATTTSWHGCGPRRGTTACTRSSPGSKIARLRPAGVK